MTQQLRTLIRRFDEAIDSKQPIPGLTQCTIELGHLLNPMAAEERETLTELKRTLEHTLASESPTIRDVLTEARQLRRAVACYYSRAVISPSSCSVADRPGKITRR